jgi:hypothetical protein
MKKTPEEIKKLRENLPSGYAKIVKTMLAAKNKIYSEETIKKVASGIRQNIFIDIELSELALAYSKNKEKVKSNFKQLKK